MQRVVDSQVFRRATALRAFLLYITNHAISGQVEKLKEQTIGAEVLGRKPNYNPAEDNIVRVRAHELRERLQKYFACEGAQEPVTITIPRGAYAPEFVVRELVVKDIPVATKVTEIVPASAIATARPTRWRWIAFAAILVVAIGTSVGLTHVAVKSSSRAGSTEPKGAIRDFWGQFFAKPNQELKIIYSDASFALWQDLSGTTMNLGEYLNHKYLHMNSDKLFNVAGRRVSSTADTTISTRMGMLAGQFGGQVNVQFARDASADYLRHGNAALIGSHRSNPWVEVFEPSLNFELGQDPLSGAPLFRNRAPQAGESPAYAIPAMFDTQRTEEKEFTSYAVVALLKGCGDRGLIVLTEGLNMQATQAAGDLVTDPQRLDTLLHSIGHKPGTTVAPFEALIQVTSLPAEYDSPKVIAYRLHQNDPCVGG